MEEMNVDGLTETIARLGAAAGALEQAVARMCERQASFAAEANETVGRIVATVETAREAELERKLAAAEARIAELAASAAPAGRRTLPAGVARLMAKEGMTGESFSTGAVDTALASLNIEQRIAVKSALLRAGMVQL